MSLYWCNCTHPQTLHEHNDKACPRRSDRWLVLASFGVGMTVGLLWAVLL